MSGAAVPTRAQCVVEGREYDVGADEPICLVEDVGLVHRVDPPHTVLGDALDPELLPTPETLDGSRADE